MKKLKSKIHREMNNFFQRLEEALNNLPDNPKPECEGFFLAYYDNSKGITTCEPLGEIPRKKWFKYNYFAQKKCAQTMYKNQIRSKNFAQDDLSLELFPGGAIFDGDGCGTSAHESMIDEAISVLSIKAFQTRKTHRPTFFLSHEFGIQLLDYAKMYTEKFANDNKWIVIIANLIADQVK